MTDIKRELIITVNSVDFTLGFPTVGQFMAIERQKARLSGGMYDSMTLSNMISQHNALDVIDSISYLSVLCPELTESLKTDNLQDVDLVDAMPLIKVFKSDVKPWIDQWMAIFKEPDDKPKKKAKTGSGGKGQE